MRKMNRKGISGLGYVMVFLGIISAAVIVATLFPYVARSFTRRAILVIEGTPIVFKEGTNWYLYVTVKNCGTVPASVNGVILAEGDSWSTSGNCSQQVNPGSSITIKIAIGTSAPPADAKELNGVLITSAGEVPFKALILGRE